MEVDRVAESHVFGRRSIGRLARCERGKRTETEYAADRDVRYGWREDA